MDLDCDLIFNSQEVLKLFLKLEGKCTGAQQGLVRVRTASLWEHVAEVSACILACQPCMKRSTSERASVRACVRACDDQRQTMPTITRSGGHILTRTSERQLIISSIPGLLLSLWQSEALYEALYDVLNQAFVRRETGGPEGSVQKFLRLAIGKRSQLCPVHDRFRIIAVAEQEHARQTADRREQ